MTALQRELHVFEASLPTMLERHRGAFVVIHAGEVVSFFPTHEDALDFAYDRFGLAPFFVKQVTEEDRAVVHYTRDLGPCGR